MRRSLVAGILFASSLSSQAATWTPLTNLAPTSGGTMLLLTDGTVMMQGANPYSTWVRLTPSSTGSFADGAWSTLARMSTQRLYFASHVLPSGKVWVLGGEYSGTVLTADWTNTGEIYDPVGDAWTPVAPHPEKSFGDVPSMLLPNGRILAGSLRSGSTYLYDIATNRWSFAASKVYPDHSDEEGWVKLPGGRVLTYDLFTSAATDGQYAEQYDPTTNSWASISPSDRTAGGFIPQLSSAKVGFELGPAVRLRDRRLGQVLILGATGHTARYDLRSNTWKAGPDIIGTLTGAPALFGADDAPAAVMPNGRVLFAADAGPTRGKFSAPTQLFVYDGKEDTVSPVSPGIPDGGRLGTVPSYVTRMLVLPTGQILFSAASSQLWLYTPDGEASRGSRPVIDELSYKGGGVFTLAGRGLNGQSAGAAYGDDAESDENYPIVRLVSRKGTVLYARSSNWSSTGVGTASPETVDFTLHPATTPGRYRLIVSGAGISSEPVCVFIPSRDVRGVPGDQAHSVRRESCED